MASTRTVYMQKADEARTTGKVLGLPRWAVEIIPSLTPGIAVWDVNGDVQVVKHIVTEHERPLVFTDRAMTETSAEAAALLAGAAAAAAALPAGSAAEEAAALEAAEAERLAALPAPSTPVRAIAAGNQQPLDRDRRWAVEPIDADGDDELTAIAGTLFGRKAELPYQAATETPEVWDR
jgi:hypothetical protein